MLEACASHYSTTNYLTFNENLKKSKLINEHINGIMANNVMNINDTQNLGHSHILYDGMFSLYLTTTIHMHWERMTNLKKSEAVKTKHNMPIQNL